MNRGIIGAIVAIVVVGIIAAGSWYTVDQTERGVRLRYGAVIGTEYGKPVTGDLTKAPDARASGLVVANNAVR